MTDQDSRGIKFTQIRIYVEEARGSGTFVQRCIMNAERGISVNPEFNDVPIADCDDLDLPNTVEKFMTQVTAEATGSGTLFPQDVDYWFDWSLSGESRAVKARILTTELSFDAKCGPFNPTGSQHGVATAEISLMSHGKITKSTVADATAPVTTVPAAP